MPERNTRFNSFFLCNSITPVFTYMRGRFVFFILCLTSNFMMGFPFLLRCKTGSNLVDRICSGGTSCIVERVQVNNRLHQGNVHVEKWRARDGRTLQDLRPLQAISHTNKAKMYIAPPGPSESSIFSYTGMGDVHQRMRAGSLQNYRNAVRSGLNLHNDKSCLIVKILMPLVFRQPSNQTNLPFPYYAIYFRW